MAIMNKSRLILILALLAVIAAGGWVFWKRSPRLQAMFRHPPEKAASAGSERKPLSELPLPVPKPPAVTEQEAFPLGVKAGLLTPDSIPPVSTWSPIAYMAPLYGESDSPSSATQSFESCLRFYLRQTPRDKLLINWIPYDYIAGPYAKEDGSGKETGRKPEEYLRDAQRLGCDVFIYGRMSQNSSLISVQLASMDLKTSKPGTWQSSATPDRFNDLFGEAIRACAGFCGLAQEQITQAEMDRHLPNAATWNLLSRGTDPDYEVLQSAIAADPDCLVLRDLCIPKDDSAKTANEALKVFRDNAVLMRTKARFLRNQKHGYAAAMVLSELLQRYPDSLLLGHDMLSIAEAAFPDEEQASKPPPFYEAGVELLARNVKKHPENWCLRWDYGDMCGNLGSYVRGAETADMVPRESWEVHGRMSRIHRQQLDAAAEIYPECPRLQMRVLSAHFTDGHTDLDWQKSIIDRVHAADPSNTAAEITMAYSHSVGWSGDQMYLPLIELAAKRHWGDTRALARICESIAQDMHRMNSFGRASWQKMCAPDGEEANLLVKCSDAASAGGQEMSSDVENALRFIYTIRGQTDKLNAQLSTGKAWWANHQEANRAMAKGDWARMYEQGKLALEHSPAGNRHREPQHYFVIKSLWKLQRHEESLKAAEAAILEFPHAQMGHYMFAVVALDKNTRLEEAYKHAKIAVGISKDNEGCNETYEKLRALLKKTD